MNHPTVPKFDDIIYIPNSILNEIKSNVASNIMDMVFSSNKISIIDPQQPSLSHVIKVADTIGQKGLSRPDIDLLALAWELSKEHQVNLLSDDYALRNVTHELQIISHGFKTKGGKQKRYYSFQCKACGERYNHTIKECEICGHQRFNRLRNR